MTRDERAVVDKWILETLRGSSVPLSEASFSVDAFLDRHMGKLPAPLHENSRDKIKSSLARLVAAGTARRVDLGLEGYAYEATSLLDQIACAATRRSKRARPPVVEGPGAARPPAERRDP